MRGEKWREAATSGEKRGGSVSSESRGAALTHHVVPLLPVLNPARRRLAKALGQPGSIVFIGSANAEIVGENRADYCISKAGVGMMAKLFAARLAADGIAVFEVRPGVIRTAMTAPATEKYDALLAAGGIPMQRWGEPSDVGRTVAALVTGAIPYATGIHIDVGGGLQLHRV